MNTFGNDEHLQVLKEIRDLLVPVADAYRDDYERRQVERLQRLQEQVRSALSSPKHRRAWELADGSLTQAQIAKETGMDSGNASRFFKKLRELGAIGPDGNPRRVVEV